MGDYKQADPVTLKGRGLTIEAFTRILGTLRWLLAACTTSVHDLSWVMQARLADHSTIPSIVGETEEFWARETWAIAGKQSRLTSDVATSAVLMWVEG
jgi:hypothetical protein